MLKQGRACLFAAISASILSTTTAFADEIASLDKHGDITAMCGKKPAFVAFQDGFGGATWFKTAAAEVKDELSKCPTVTKFVYLDANNDQQRYNSDINGIVAQGANIVITFAHFGDSSLPLFKSVKRAGVVMVPYFSKIGGEIGKDYDGTVLMDQESAGLRWADWFSKSVVKGNVIFLGGTPGATSSERFLAGLKKGLAKYPDLKLLDEHYVVTNWNPVDAQKAVAALIAKYDKIDGIATDYGVTTMAAIKAYEQAGLPVPAQASIASNNELNCKYLDLKKQGKAWRYYSLDGTTTLVRFAARRAMSIYEGTPDTEPVAVQPFVYADSTTGLDPKCDPSLPPDADMSGQLGDEKLKKLLAP